MSSESKGYPPPASPHCGVVCALLLPLSIMAGRLTHLAAQLQTFDSHAGFPIRKPLALAPKSSTLILKSHHFGTKRLVVSATSTDNKVSDDNFPSSGPASSSIRSKYDPNCSLSKNIVIFRLHSHFVVSLKILIPKDMSSM